MGRQFCYKVVLESLGTKPQVEDDHAEEKKETKIKRSKVKQSDSRKYLGSFPAPKANLITRTTNVSAVKNLRRRSGDDQTNNHEAI